jgi:uncharacterized glyoxalase superfamily protein PhnB
MKAAFAIVILILFTPNLSENIFMTSDLLADLPTHPPVQGSNDETRIFSVGRITSILTVEAIEPCLKFWVDTLGFEKTAEVKDGESLGFVSLSSGKVEVMLQTYNSLQKDIPDILEDLRSAPSVLYIEVNDIREIERRLKNFKVVVPKRKTFYGAEEIYFRSPGGHIIGFAQQRS